MARPLPPQVRQLGWISFFADICSEMVYPVLPLFLKEVLRAPAAAIGLVEGLAEAVVSFMKGWSGFHSDKTGKRLPFVQWGYGLSALGKPLLALAHVWPLVLLGRIVDRFGKGIRTTARDTLIADAVEKSDLGRAFGFHRAMDTAGALVGVGIGYLLLQAMPGQYRQIFLLAAVPGVVSVLLALRLKEPAPEPTDDKPEPGFGALKHMPTAYWHAITLSVLFALANTSDTFLLLRARDLGFSATNVILAYAAYNVTYTLLSYSMGALSDKVGRWPVVGGGWVLYAGVYTGFAFLSPSSAGVVWPLFALYGVYMAMTQGATKALVAQHAPAQLKGTAMGFFYMVVGLATLVGNLAFGLIWDQAGSSTALYVSGSLALMSALLIPLVVKRAGV